jgi:hypothetical protein
VASTTELERLAAVEQRIVDHESRCEERLTEIKASAAGTLKAVEGLKSRFWTISLALLAWALAQVWAASQTRLAHLESPRSEVVERVDHIGCDVRWPRGHQGAEAFALAGEERP